MPLLTLLVPFTVGTTTNNRFEIHAKLRENRRDVCNAPDIGNAAALKCHVHCLVLVIPHDEGLKDHTPVAVKKSENHIKMDERLRRMGQLLHNHMLFPLALVAAQTGNKHINSLCAGSRAVAYQQNILAGDKDIATLHKDIGIAGMEIVGIYDIAVERTAPLENRLHDKRLPHPHLIGHPAHKGIVADGHRSIPGKIEVVQRRQGIILIIQVGGKGVNLCGNALNQASRKLCRRHSHKIIKIIRSPLLNAHLAYKRLPLPVILKDRSQKIHHLINICIFSQHTLQLLILALGN